MLCTDKRRRLTTLDAVTAAGRITYVYLFTSTYTYRERAVLPLAQILLTFFLSGYYKITFTISKQILPDVFRCFFNPWNARPSLGTANIISSLISELFHRLVIFAINVEHPLQGYTCHVWCSGEWNQTLYYINRLQIAR